MGMSAQCHDRSRRCLRCVKWIMLIDHVIDIRNIRTSGKVDLVVTWNYVCQLVIGHDYVVVITSDDIFDTLVLRVMKFSSRT
jgi:hypothetical protein